MTPDNIATRQQWLTARRALLVEEKALTRQKDVLARARRELPWVLVDTDYEFETSDGACSLSDLFGSHSQLIIYHFMYGPDWGDAGCVSCSYCADTFNGLTPHLNARDVGFVVVSRAPMHKITPFKARMGWNFTWVSSCNSNFNPDFNVGFGEGDAPADGPKMYNFKEGEGFPADEAPGISVFAKDDAGKVFHTYSTYGRGLDMVVAGYCYIDMTPKGRDENHLDYPMQWVRHHDNYGAR